MVRDKLVRVMAAKDGLVVDTNRYHHGEVDCDAVEQFVRVGVDRDGMVPGIDGGIHSGQVRIILLFIEVFNDEWVGIRFALVVKSDATVVGKDVQFHRKALAVHHRKGLLYGFGIGQWRDGANDTNLEWQHGIMTRSIGRSWRNVINRNVINRNFRNEGFADKGPLRDNRDFVILEGAVMGDVLEAIMKCEVLLEGRLKANNVRLPNGFVVVVAVHFGVWQLMELLLELRNVKRTKETNGGFGKFCDDGVFVAEPAHSVELWDVDVVVDDEVVDGNTVVEDRKSFREMDHDGQLIFDVAGAVFNVGIPANQEI